MWALFVMYNKSINFISSLNRKKYFLLFKPAFSIWWLTSGMEVMEKYKISINLCLLDQKTQGNGL